MTTTPIWSDLDEANARESAARRRARAFQAEQDAQEAEADYLDLLREEGAR